MSKHIWKLTISLLLFGVLIITPWQRVFASNVAMIALVGCLVPIKWVLYPDRPNPPAATQPLPDVECISEAHQLSVQGDDRVQARMALLDGDLARRQGEWLPAIEHYRYAATLLDSPMPDLWFTVSAIYMLNLKDSRSALTVTLQALQQSPRHQGLRVHAAELYLFYLPPYGDAVKALEVIQPERGFDHPYPYVLAANAYLQIGKLQQGLQMAEKAVQLGRTYGGADLANALYTLGVLQRCTDQQEVGITTLREAQVLVPDTGSIQTALGEGFRSLCGPVASKSR